MAERNDSWLSEDASKNQEAFFQSFLSEDESKDCSFSTSFAIYRDASMISNNSAAGKENGITDDNDTEHEDEENYIKDSFVVSDSDSYYSTNDVSMLSISSPIQPRSQPARFSKIDLNAPPSRREKNPKLGSNWSSKINDSHRNENTLSVSNKSQLNTTVLDNVDEAERNLLLELYPELNNSQSSSTNQNDLNKTSNESFQLHIEYVDNKTKTEEPEVIDLTSDSLSFQKSPTPVTIESSPENYRKNNRSIDKRLNESSDDDDAFEKYLQSLKKPSQPQEDSESEQEPEERDKGFIVSDDDESYASSVESDKSGFIDDEEEYSDDSSSASDISAKKAPSSKAHIFSQQFNTPSMKEKPINKDDHFLNSLSVEFDGKRHPDAVKYIQKGIKTAKLRNELTEKLFELYKKRCFDDELPMNYSNISWNARLRKTAGLCRNSLSRKTSVIELSTKVCTTPERLRDTLIHELCHSATWLMDGVYKAGHGPVWRKWAIKCLRKCPSLPNIERCHSYDIEAKYVYVCNGCGQRVKRHSRSLDIQKKICGRCRGRFELLGDKSEKKREPTKFAQFVKDNYGKYRTTGTNHKEIMKKLSEAWKSKEVESVVQTLDISVLSIHD